MNPATATATATITIRPAYADDDAGLVRLAALDSAEAAPERPLLLAEVDGQLRAALSLRDGAAVADPFFATAELLALLRLRADEPARPRRRLSALSRRRPTPAHRGSRPPVRAGAGGRSAPAA
jgi:hypothetical protein